MGRGLALGSCVAVTCALLGTGAALGTPARGTAASDSGRQLVFMQQVRPVTITPQSVSVDANGDAAVIIVIGELTIPKPVRFHLGSHELALLRHLLDKADLPALHIEAPIPFVRSCTPSGPPATRYASSRATFPRRCAVW